MNLKIKQLDSNSLDSRFDVLRKKNYEASFDGVKDFIRQSNHKLHQRRGKRPIRKWQWIIALLVPVLVILACTKVERAEPVGQTISFSVQVEDDAAVLALERIVGGFQKVIFPNRQKPGYASYTCLIPSQSNYSVDDILGALKNVEGISDLSAVRLNTRIKESLLSQIGGKIFSTHIDANDLSDVEMQQNVNRQLKDQGINNISINVTRNESGVRMLQLQSGKVGPNYRIDVSNDDNGTRMVLQEERGDIPKIAGPINEQTNFQDMTDLEVRNYIRSKYGKNLRDDAIVILRTPGEIAITIKQSDKKEQIIRFKVN